MLINRRRSRNIALQAGFLIVALLILGSAVVIGKFNIEAQGVTPGFAFLGRATGFELGFSLFETSPYDSYARFLLAGVVNTIFLGLLGIALANVVGMIIAVFRISSNGVLNAIGTTYIETFRNVPLILQTVFWYAMLTHLPGPKQAYRFADAVYLSARGIYLPGLSVTGLATATFFLLAAIWIVVSLWFAMARRFKKLPQRVRRTTLWIIIAAGVLAGLTVLVLGRIADAPLVSIPEQRGLNIRDGLRIPPELAALAIAMATYGGAFIAEVLRAGFLAVGRGQVEAAQSLGLLPWHVFWRVRLPLALRAVLPTLINQYVWLFKSTTLGIAIGFADFFAVVSVAINQIGQTLELMAILMLGFLLMNNTIAFALNRLNKAIALKGV